MEVHSVVKRGMTGTTSTTTFAGERIEGFVPLPLPPHPPLVMDGRLQTLLEAATLAMGHLDGVSTLLPDKAPFLYAFVRKEALVSSQIEGTRSSLSGLLLFEADEMPGVPLDDVQEVSSYVAALDRSRIEGATGRRAGSALRVHEALKTRPLRSITDLAATTGLSFPAAAAAVDALVGLGVAREFTGRRRDRLFVYERYVAILGEGTEVAVDR